MLVINIIQYIGTKFNIPKKYIRILKILYIYYVNTMALIFSLVTLYLSRFKPNDKFKFFVTSSMLYLLLFIDYSVFTKNLFKSNIFISNHSTS